MPFPFPDPGRAAWMVLRTMSSMDLHAVRLWCLGDSAVRMIPPVSDLQAVRFAPAAAEQAAPKKRAKAAK